MRSSTAGHTFVTDETRVNGTVAGNQQSPSVKSLIDDSYIYIWQGARAGSSNTDIFGQRFGNNQIPLGSEFVVNNATEAGARSPNVASLGSAGLIVVWQGGVQNDGATMICAQRYDLNGAALGPEIDVSGPRLSFRMEPTVVGFDDGRFVINWQSFGQDGSGWGIYARQFTETGLPVAQEVLVNIVTAGSQRTPSIMKSGDGGYIAAWASDDAASGFGVFARGFDASGQPAGGAVQLSNATSFALENPALTRLEGGGFIAVWQSGDANSDIHARIFDALGTPRGQQFTVNSTLAGRQSMPSVAPTNGGGFMIIWQGDAISGGPADIFAQTFTSDGQKIGLEEQINRFDSNLQSAPQAARLAGGDILVTWESNTQDGDGLGVYSTVLRPNQQPTGNVVILGDLEEGAMLSADISGLFTPDRVGEVRYQWLRNGVDIVGGAAPTFQITQAEVLSFMALRVTYTDQNGIVETVVSDPTTAISDLNEPAVGDFRILGRVQVGEELTAAPVEISDANGVSSIEYRWYIEGFDAPASMINKLQLETYYLGRTISLEVTVQDRLGNISRFTNFAETAVEMAERAIYAVGDAVSMITASGSAPNILSQVLLQDGSVVAIYAGSGMDNQDPQLVHIMADGSVAAPINLLAGIMDLDRVLKVRVFDDGHSVVLFEAGGQWHTKGFDLAGQEIMSSAAATDSADLPSFNQLGTLRAEILSDENFLLYTNNPTPLEGYTGEGVNAAFILSVFGVELLASDEINVPFDNYNYYGDMTWGSASFAAHPLSDGLFYFKADASWADFKGYNDGSSSQVFAYDMIGIPVAGENLQLQEVLNLVRPTDELRVLNDGLTTFFKLSGTMAQKYAFNQAPTGDLHILNAAEEGVTLLAIPTAVADADGLGTLSYTWLRDFQIIAGANSDAYTLTRHDIGKQISVFATYTDGHGTVERIISDVSAVIRPENYGVEGGLRVFGTGQSISVDAGKLTDRDGLGPFSYQWLRDGQAITDGTLQSYQFQSIDDWHQISAVVTYVDGRGNLEAVASDTNLFRVGGVGSDYLIGTAGRDLIFGLNGADHVYGGHGSDILIGGAGDDVLYGDGLGPATKPELSAQIYRLYKATLDRAPDAIGHLNWVTLLAKGNIGLVDAAKGFVGSQEFNNVYGALNNAQFVELLYENVLNRASDANGLARWTGMLETGATRADVVIGFSQSQEFKTSTVTGSTAFAASMQPMAVGSGPENIWLDPRTIWVDEVYRLYQAMLDRAPDIVGLYGWTGTLACGTNLLGIVTGFVNSREFQAIYGNLHDVLFVNVLYKNVLNREADAAGLTYWTGQLASGASREAIVLGFSQSREFINVSNPVLETWMRVQNPDDVLDGGAGENVLIGGMLSDTFVFDAIQGGTHRVMDLEVWDSLEFRGFGYANDADARRHMSQIGEDVVFVDQGLKATFVGMNLGFISDAMIL